VTVALSTAKAITAFSLVGATGSIDELNKTIAVTVPNGTNVTALVATFTTTGVSVAVDGTPQTSGTTVNDFTYPVTYMVTAADGSTANYIVTVTVAPASAKAITAFSIAGVKAVINETNKTIALTMPFDTGVTALVASFTTTGASVAVGAMLQTSGVTPNDFTNPVIYTVTAVDNSTVDYTVTVSVPTLQERINAATTTAQNNSLCTAISPFYWEIGNNTQALAAGSVGGTTYTASTSMNIASASKWLYGAYVAEVRGGVVTADDIKYLTFTSGYTSFQTCLSGDTVAQCANRAINDAYTAANDGKFYYGGEHMQQHATVQMSLGALDNVGLAAEMQNVLGTDIDLSYSQPQLAGGVVSTASDYAVFLRKILNADLKITALLGTYAVCTNPLTCSTAVYTPVPTDESWHYSLGHWVEDDPTVGDGSFSSAGAFGFYPWIDANKTTYGILAREGPQGAGVASVYCGRLIRKAWFTGTAQ
jgi:hypothetical protein